MIDKVILAKKINLVRNYGCPIYSRANLFSLLVLEKKHEDLLSSLLHLLAVEAPASEAPWGQLSHPDKPLTDHHACPQVCSEGLWRCVVVGSDASALPGKWCVFQGQSCVIKGERSGEDWQMEGTGAVSLSLTKEKPSREPESRVFSSKSMGRQWDLV